MTHRRNTSTLESSDTVTVLAPPSWMVRQTDRGEACPLQRKTARANEPCFSSHPMDSDAANGMFETGLRKEIIKFRENVSKHCSIRFPLPINADALLNRTYVKSKPAHKTPRQRLVTGCVPPLNSEWYVSSFDDNFAKWPRCRPLQPSAT